MVESGFLSRLSVGRLERSEIFSFNLQTCHESFIYPIDFEILNQDTVAAETAAAPAAAAPAAVHSATQLQPLVGLCPGLAHIIAGPVCPAHQRGRHQQAGTMLAPLAEGRRAPDQEVGS